MWIFEVITEQDKFKTRTLVSPLASFQRTLNLHCFFVNCSIPV